MERSPGSPGSPSRGQAEPLVIPPSLAMARSEVRLETEVLGVGGFAQVVKGVLLANPAKGRAADIAVAVKVMVKANVSRSSFNSLQNEINICAELRHPCIINTWGIIDEAASLYIVMDLAGGGELFKYMQKYGLEDMPLVAPNLLGEVVLGLEYMQQQGVIHRDIKPENLLLTEDFHVKIADFGTVCLMSDPQSNTFTGTPNYVSPEVLATSSASRTSDLWALGCIVYQMFVGRPPFQGETQYLVMQAIKERRLTFPPGERYFPAAARDLVDRLLTMDPEARIGARGFDEIKQHPFFASVSWDTILSASNITHLNANHNKLWERFLFEKENVIYCSKIVKKRFLSVKHRWLLLTDYPRLFYIDPETEIMKGQVPWSDSVCAAAEDDVNFVVHTPDRDYIFSDAEKRAGLWVMKINDLVKRKKA